MVAAVVVVWVAAVTVVVIAVVAVMVVVAVAVALPVLRTDARWHITIILYVAVIYI